MLPTLKAGVTLDFTTAVADYPPGAGWTLTFYLRGPGVITLTAQADGDLHRVQVNAIDTGAWTAGTYTWEARVANSGGAVHEVGSGTVEVKPNIAAQLAGWDGRSQARKALDDALAARAAYVVSKAVVAEYSIGDRRMKFHTASDFEVLISGLKIEVARESRAAALAAGQPDPRKVYVRAIRG